MQERSPIEHWPDDQLLRAAHAGNTSAFEVFVVRSIPQLWRYLRSLCPQLGLDKESAKDLAQETALRALATVRAYEGGRATLPKVSPSWLYTIARNLARDAYRKKKRSAAAEAAMEEAIRSKTPSREELEQYEEVLEFFNWLSERDREILQLVFLESLKAEEVAEKMGLTVWAVYKALERSLRRLRDLVEEHGKIMKGTKT